MSYQSNYELSSVKVWCSGRIVIIDLGMAKTQNGRELKGSEMAMMLDEFCNSGQKEEFEAFVEQLTCRTHRTLQQRIAALFVRSFEAWAGVSSFDARNEATVKLAKKFVEATGDKYDRALPFI